MKITREEILHVATLARLDLSPEDALRFTKQVGEILSYVDALSRVDTQGVEPMSHAIPLTNAFREDEARESMGPEEALKNAPESDGPDILVPKVI